MLGIGTFEILGYDTIAIFPSQCNPGLEIGLPVWVWPNLGEDSRLVKKNSYHQVHGLHFWDMLVVEQCISYLLLRI